MLTASLRTISPLLVPTISLIVSISLCFNFLHHHISHGFMALFWGSLLTFLIYTHKTPLFTPTIICIAMILLGWGRTMHIAHHFEQFPLKHIDHAVSIEGLVFNKSSAPKSRMKYCVTLQVKMIKHTPLPSTHFVQLYTPHQLDVDIGDRIALHNIHIKEVTNPRFNNYLMKEGIAATLFQESVDYTLVHRPVICVSRWLFHTKMNLLHALKRKLSHPTFILFSSLFLGEKESSKKSIDAMARQFKQWGILHILARSGLHLVMVLSAYEYMFRFLPLPLVYKYFILLLLTIIYYVLSWPSISFIRAFIIFLLYKLLSLLYIPIHFIHILLLTCVLILLVNPMQLFFIDFQLSFGLTFALGWLNLYKVNQTTN